MTGHFTLIDWGVLALYLAFTTWLGAKLAGKQSTLREFFLAGRKIPWYAVAGSAISTEISAVTLIAVPAVVYSPGGDLTYLQLMLGAILARGAIAVWFVRAFYEREIFSPYDYIGRQLGAQARLVTTGLFVLGAVLGQSVRVLLTAMVLELISGIPLGVSIWIIGAAAVVWTLLGGMATVIWTDVIQFGVFLMSMIVALIAVLTSLDHGWSDVLTHAAAATNAAGEPHNKLRLWNLEPTLRAPYTLWAALIANTVTCLAAYGTDQMMAQRIFCCATRRDAAKAVWASNAGLIVAVLAACVGLALYAYYQQHPPTPTEARLITERADRVFPIFVVRELPSGLTGLIIAGIFAAAISTLDSVLVALAQVVLTGVIKPLRESRAAAAAPAPAGSADVNAARHERRDLRTSRILVVAWAALLCGMAQVAALAHEHYKALLNLALAMATYTAGPLLAAFFLAFWKLRIDARGLLWAAPISVLCVFGVSWNSLLWARWTTLIAAILLAAAWLLTLWRERRAAQSHAALALGTLAIGVGLATAALLGANPLFDPPTGAAAGRAAVAFPWNVPLGFAVALLIGYCAARRAPLAAPCR